MSYAERWLGWGANSKLVNRRGEPQGTVCSKAVEILSEADAHIARLEARVGELEKFASDVESALRMSERHGQAKDEPEGVRTICWSETLALKFEARARALMEGGEK